MKLNATTDVPCDDSFVRDPKSWLDNVKPNLPPDHLKLNEEAKRMIDRAQALLANPAVVSNEQLKSDLESAVGMLAMEVYDDDYQATEQASKEMLKYLTQADALLANNAAKKSRPD